ncbi:MAG: CapA family protein [Proteobacteria bacterium]|nr:CapA family protein [Pseudomonadota bacterium]
MSVKKYNITFTRVVILLFLAVSSSPGCKRTVSVFKKGELTDKQLSLGGGERSVVFVGDIMTWDRTRDHLEEHGANYPFAAVAPLLRTADLTVGNLEGPIADKSKITKSRYAYKVPSWTLKGLKWAGFDLLSLANNHLYDCGKTGVKETFKHLTKAGISFFGAGENIQKATEPKIIPLGDMKIAFLGLVTGETYFHEYQSSLKKGAYARMERLMEKNLGARKDRAGTVVTTRKSIVHIVEQARRLADFVAVFIHFGIRYHRPPTSFQRDLAHAAIDAGADLVIGHHAHFWQPVEVYRNKPIVYGIGNFAFGSGNRKADEALLVRAIIKTKRLEGLELKRLELFPLYTKNKDSDVSYQTKIMKGASADEMLGRLSEQSKPFNAHIANENGRGVLRLRAAGL